MKSTLRSAILATIATYGLVFTGGLVRVSGAGLGCPDWPRCFGRWIPPTSVTQLPSNMEPGQFNFTLAWIEYLNRLFGVLVGLLILVTALLALKHFRRAPRIYLPAVLAVLLVAYTGWQGGQVVEAGLEASQVSVHALLAILIACLMIYVSQQVYYQIKPDAGGGRDYPRSWQREAAAVGLLGFLQVILGTDVRSAVEFFQQSQPLAAGFTWLSQANWLNYLHVVLGLLIIAAGVSLSVRILTSGRQLSALTWQAAWAILLLAALQGALGVLLLTLNTPPVLEILHLWSAALWMGTLLLIYAALSAAAPGGFHEAK